MTVLWILFELVVNVYQGILAVFFVFSFLSKQGIKQFFTLKNVIFSGLYALTICFENYLDLGPFKPGVSVAYVAVLLIYGIIFFKCSFIRKLFAAVLANVIMLLSPAICGNISSVIFGENLASLMVVPSLERFLTIISAQLLSLYLVFITLHINNKNKVTGEQAALEWAIVAVILVVSIIFGAYINFAVLDNNENIGVYSIFVFSLIILTNILVCWLLMNFLKKSQEASEVTLLKQTQEYNRQYIESIQAEYDTVRKLRHDYKNSLFAIGKYIESGDLEEALNYIKENIDVVSKTEVFVNTNNQTANAVINAKLSIAKSYGIESSCISISDISGIDDMDLCRLLSNMLDNAITACKNSSSSKSHITLNISGDDDNLLIALKNTIDKSVLESNPNLISTKKDKAEHGYGVKIMREIAEKYEGICDFYEENRQFFCVIYLRKKAVALVS